MLAAGYAAMAVVAGRAQGVFAALATVFATLAIPLVLAGHGVTVGWTVEATLLAALGARAGLPMLRVAGLAVLGLAAAHVGAGYATPDIAQQAGGYAMIGATHDAGDALVPFANARFAIAMLVPLAGLMFVRDRILGPIAALAGATFTLLVIHVELANWGFAPVIWALGALAALAVTTRRRDRWGFLAATGFAAIAALLVFAHYRLGSALLVTSTVAALATMLMRRGELELGRIAWTVALAGFGIVIAVEAEPHPALLSVGWAGYAAIMLGVGFWRQSRPLRLGGLGLLGLVAVKLLLFDLAGAAPLHRVLSFLIVGTLMIAASFAYHRLERNDPGRSG